MADPPPAFVTYPALTVPAHGRRPPLCARRARRTGLTFVVECKSKDKTKEKTKEKTKDKKKEKKSKDKGPDPNTVLSDAELSEWGAVREILQSLNPKLDSASADKVVARAFGWGSQKWWRGDVTYEPPRTDTVHAALQFLREEIGFDDETIGTRILKKFPEIIRMPVERMRGNVEFIQKTYPVLKGKVLLASLTEQPAALAYDVDCGGDCMSECDRCWVRFE